MSKNTGWFRQESTENRWNLEAVIIDLGRNATLTVPKDFAIGVAELTIIGTGGLHLSARSIRRNVFVATN